MQNAVKILICDYVGNSEQWLKNYAVRENFDVVATLLPNSDKNLLLENSWEYLLIFENGLRDFFDSMLLFMNIPKERVIYPLNLLSWLDHPKALLSIINIDGQGNSIYRGLIFNLGRKLNYFITCTTSDGLSYIATSMDATIMGNMYIDRQNWAQEDMIIFHELANAFYQIDDNSGLFLDLGANIGTTGIYFTKKIAPNLKLLAFEPDAENFKLLRANLILNDAEKNSTIENLGLGVEESEQTMYRIDWNPGGNGMFANMFEENASSEKIKIISLDKYFSEKNLNPEDIRYIWIDTEGFEPQVLIGAQNILRKNPAPIFMEFNPHLWQKSGYYEKMMDFLLEVYGGYIFVQEGKLDGNFQEEPIEKLWEYQNETKQLGDILLIKKH